MGIDQAVFLALLTQEFGWNPQYAYGPDTSSAGAGGAGQFMPGTWSGVVQQHGDIAERYGLTADPRDRFKPIGAIWMAAAHFADLLRSGGSYTNALIGYNAGPGWFNTPRQNLPDETQDYLRLITNFARQMGGDIARLFGGGGMTNGNGDDYSDFTLEDDRSDEDTGTGPTVFEKMFDAWLDDAYEEARQRRDRATMEAIERLRQQGDISRIGFEHELQFDPRLVGLSEQAAELEIKIQAAAEAGNRETQLLLLRERAKLDEEAEKAGFQRELWIRAVDQAFDAKENALHRETQLRGQAIGELGANARAC